MPAPRKRQIVQREDGTLWIGHPGGTWYQFGEGPWCGTLAGYKHHACRCNACKHAQTRHGEKYRSSDQAKENRAKYRRRRDSAIRSIDEILALADNVVDGTITAEQAIHQIIKTYG